MGRKYPSWESTSQFFFNLLIDPTFNTSDMLLLLAVGAACSWAQPSRFSPPGPLEPHFMMLLSTGCSGSTWVFDTLVKMIEAHRLANHSSVLPVMLGPTRFVASTPRTRDSCDPPAAAMVGVEFIWGHSERALRVTFLLCALIPCDSQRRGQQQGVA